MGWGFFSSIGKAVSNVAHSVAKKVSNVVDKGISIGHKVQNGTLVTSGLGNATSTHQSNLSVEVSAAHTANYDFEKAFYDIEIQAGTNVERVIEGSVTLSREITQYWEIQ